jgi:hypothetical protein
MLVESLLTSTMDDTKLKRSTNSFSQDIESSIGLKDKPSNRKMEVEHSITTIHDQINVRDKRREERLKRMKERQFDQPTLHQLFRIFDSTNSHVLSLSDFQTGLIAMGFREAEGIIILIAYSVGI